MAPLLQLTGASANSATLVESIGSPCEPVVAPLRKGSRDGFRPPRSLRLRLLPRLGLLLFPP